MTFSTTNGTGQFSLSPTTANQTVETVGRDVYTLQGNPTSLQLQITGVANPAVAYFDNAVSSSVWNDLTNSTSCNWSLNYNGTRTAPNIPGAVTDVIMSAATQSGSAVTTTLGANITINSLNVNATAASKTIATPEACDADDQRPGRQQYQFQRLHAAIRPATASRSPPARGLSPSTSRCCWAAARPGRTVPAAR